MTGSDDKPVYSFGDFALDTARGELTERGDAVELRAQSLQVLQVLVENHGRLVSKDELNAKVWGRKAVTDDSLAQCLVDIRKALHDADRTLVRTVPRRGYRFDAVVTTVAAPDAAVEVRRATALFRIIVPAAVLALALLAAGVYWLSADRHPSVAVLRFHDLGAGGKLQYIGDGLAEDILNSLAHHPDISVIARTSSFAYSDGEQDVAAIAEALNADYVLEGSVRELDTNQFRIVAQLIETGRSTHEWSASFDVSLAELDSVHHEVSREVARRMAPSSDVHTDTIFVPGFSADELMLLARHFELQLRERAEVDSEVLADALRWYRNAAAADPDSAKIQAGLARVLMVSGDTAAAGYAVERAVELDPGLSEVQEVLGRYRWLNGVAGAGSAWQQAVALNPSNVEAVGALGYWYWVQGHIAEAEILLERALELDPASLSRYADLGNFLGNEARVDEVRDLAGRIQQRFDSAESYRVIARLLDLVGYTDESIAWLVRARDKDPGNPVYAWALAELFIDIGDFATARRLDPEPSPGLVLKMGRYEEFIDTAEDRLFDEPDNLVLRYLLAFAYNVVGRPELALWQLERVDVLNFNWPETRQVWDMEAFLTWAAAKAAVGHSEESLALMTEWIDERPHTASPNWWRPFVHACGLSTLGRNEEAIEYYRRIMQSPRLPALYLVRDASCTKKFHGDPRYEEVIDHVEQRQREFRERVPQTLGRYGVHLPELQDAPRAR